MRELKVKRGKLKGREAMRIFLRGLVAVVFFLITVSVFAQDIPARPVPPRLVNDFANVLSAKHVKMLEEKLVRFNDTTSTQICVVTIDDLGGTTTADFAYQIGEKWGVGHKENNGAVILIKPKTDNERGGVSIQVGYGLEPIITDALAKRIIEQEMIPAFKVDDYYTAIDKATDAIIGLASGQFSADDYNNKEDSSGAAIVIIILIIMVFVIILLGRNNKNNGGTISGKDDDSDIWKTLFWASLFMNSHNRNSGWGGFSGGSGGFGGGGGFGGFGGGHFGGGGASGSW